MCVVDIQTQLFSYILTQNEHNNEMMQRETSIVRPFPCC